MPGAKTKTELIRVGLPARLVTVRKFLEALGDDVNGETIVRHHAGSLIVEEPYAQGLRPDPTLIQDEYVTHGAMIDSHWSDTERVADPVADPTLLSDGDQWEEATRGV